MPPVQKMAIFVFLNFFRSLSTKFLNSLKLFVLGLIEFLKVPTLNSKSFLTSIKIVFLSFIKSFQFSGLIFFPVIFSGTAFLDLSVTISFLSLTLSRLKGIVSLYETTYLINCQSIFQKLT